METVLNMSSFPSKMASTSLAFSRVMLVAREGAPVSEEKHTCKINLKFIPSAKLL